ncbi:MAG: 2-hydroxyacyl-CoA dehydratase family protein [Dehalococcoidia bacterium]|nr:2-hydroxyacyl-CoA dehydratase family protein [Dehalococcoidia bacterium]
MTARLLELCGYTPAEIDAALPDVNKVFDRLGLTQADVLRAQERIKRYYQPELEGMRKVMGVYMRELVDLVLARERGKKKIIYASIPTGCAGIISAASFSSPEVHAVFPDVLVDYVLGGFFNKLDPILEAAEKSFMRPGVAHCALIKLRLGLMMKGQIPKGDLLISMGNICDEVCKSDELISEYFDIPVHYINLTQDWSGPEDSERERQFFAREIARCAERVGEVVGFEISKDMATSTRHLKKTISSVVEKINRLILESDPMPIKAAAIDLVRFMKSMPFARSNLDAATDAVEILLVELQRKVAQGEGVVPKGAPRVLLGLVSPIPDPSLADLAEELGIALLITETQIYVPDGDLMPNMDEVADKDPWEKYANSLTARCLTSGPNRRVRAVAGACKKLNLDGVLWFYHYACRTLATDALMVKHFVEQETGLPVLVLEGDVYDPRYYTSGQLRTRVEAFAEMLKAGQVARATAG